MITPQNFSSYFLNYPCWECLEFQVRSAALMALQPLFHGPDLSAEVKSLAEDLRSPTAVRWSWPCKSLRIKIIKDYCNFLTLFTFFSWPSFSVWHGWDSEDPASWNVATMWMPRWALLHWAVPATWQRQKCWKRRPWLGEVEWGRKSLLGRGWGQAFFVWETSMLIYWCVMIFYVDIISFFTNRRKWTIIAAAPIWTCYGK